MRILVHILISILFLSCQKQESPDRKPANWEEAAGFVGELNTDFMDDGKEEPTTTPIDGTDGGAHPIEKPDLSYLWLPIKKRGVNLFWTFKGLEDKYCYDYRALAVANQKIERYFNEQALLDAVYTHGRIILHHTAGDGGADSVIRYHKEDKGWSDTGYHFIIEKNGDVVEGRDLKYMGAHAGRFKTKDQDCARGVYKMSQDEDYRSIGIALVGNFHEGNNRPTAAQLESLETLISNLKKQYQIEEVIGHDEVSDKDCPGKNFRSSMGRDFKEPKINGMQKPSSLGLNKRQKSQSPFINGDLKCNYCQ